MTKIPDAPRMPNRGQLWAMYHQQMPIYEKLGKNLKEAIKTLLAEAQIDVLDVSFRTKSFDSFRDKFDRHQFTDPINQIEDICGLRIIAFYESDLDKIDQVVKKEFTVHESSDKQDSLEPNQFGYRSHHHTVTVKKEWLAAPNFRGLGDIKAEIQVRTILMHAWANLSHQMQYKQEANVPRHLQRELSSLIAAFENADKQLSTLRKEKDDYQKKLSSQPDTLASQELNIDTLQAFFDQHFPDLNKDSHHTARLLHHMSRLGTTMKDLITGLEIIKPYLKNMQAETISLSYQPQMAGLILCITNDLWWEFGKKDILSQRYLDLIDKYRDKIKQQQNK